MQGCTHFKSDHREPVQTDFRIQNRSLGLIVKTMPAAHLLGAHAAAGHVAARRLVGRAAAARQRPLGVVGVPRILSRTPGCFGRSLCDQLRTAQLFVSVCVSRQSMKTQQAPARVQQSGFIGALWVHMCVSRQRLQQSPRGRSGSPGTFPPRPGPHPQRPAAAGPPQHPPAA